jgi:hypothetical protein
MIKKKKKRDLIRNSGALEFWNWYVHVFILNIFYNYIIKINYYKNKLEKFN